ncbi:hypothetical protein BVY04_04865 [bacterium M21]|nr:hypothetical protein BVY04_04865 [bacterium M21]
MAVLVFNIFCWQLQAADALKVAKIFSSHMVLQQNAKVPIWGWAAPTTEVMVTFAGQSQKAVTDKDGKWQVKLTPLKTSKEGRSMTISGAGSTTTLEDILVGEVWLCSGQSNMEWKIDMLKIDTASIKAAAEFPLIRHCKVARRPSPTPQKDCIADWQICSPKTVGTFSATAYFFGMNLHKELDVPIGLVNSSWGGTPIESWLPFDQQRDNEAIQKLKANFDRQATTYDEVKEKEKFDAATAKWKESIKGMDRSKINWRKRPKMRAHPHKSQRYPGSLYNGMIVPLETLAIRGAIWYQGESNARSVETGSYYKKQLTDMITSWRTRWQQHDDFPFYFVQLPNFMAPQKNPVDHDAMWPVVRESFYRVHKDLKNAAMAITIDIGEEKNIHPGNKAEAGRRLALQALQNAYSKPIVGCGPVFKSHKIVDNKVILTFDNIGSGLMAKDGELKTFAIAGADKKFVWATASTDGKTVTVSSDEVVNPAAVRYAWANNPIGCNLYNKENLPASPFRTDDWELNRK